MAIQEIAPKYQTTDGRKFDTALEAERHEKLSEVKSKLTEAQHAFSVALVKSCKTADGEMFDFSFLRDYFCVDCGYASVPTLERVSFSQWGLEIETSDGFENISLIQASGNGKKFYPIRNLYVNQRKANQALIAAIEKYLQQEQQNLDELKAKYGD